MARRHSSWRASTTEVAGDGAPGDLAHLVVQHAIRALATAGAEPGDLGPDRISFVATLRVVRRYHVNDKANSFSLSVWSRRPARPEPGRCDG